MTPAELERWREVAYRAARGRGLNADQADDCASEVVLGILESERSQGAAWPEGLPHWYVRAIVANVVMDALRGACRLREREVLCGAPCEAKGYSYDPSEGAHAMTVLEGMREDERAIVRLTTEGYTSAEVGAALGCSAACVRKRLSRLRRHARAESADSAG